MALKCGIVGLPNVGKSTLFNALTETMAAESANYPFCTIEPNEGIVSVPDARLDKLAVFANSKEIIPTRLSFIDIAGLVKGASKGEGLGNQFLANIREVDAIIHVVRCFDDDNIIHVEGSADPLRDIGIIDTELMLADMESLSKRIPALEKKLRANDKEATLALKILREVLALLEAGRPARDYAVPDAEHKRAFDMLQLLTAKPVLYVCNVAENELNGNNHTAKVPGGIIISAKIEQEISILASEEKKDFMEALSLPETGLSKVIRGAYYILNLITFFTIGPKEAHAWTIHQGAKAPEAAGVIHTDFEKGFIRAETVSYKDYMEFGSEAKARENGRLRTEGKDYVVMDGDIFHFLFN